MSGVKKRLAVTKKIKILGVKKKVLIRKKNKRITWKNDRIVEFQEKILIIKKNQIIILTRKNKKIILASKITARIIRTKVLRISKPSKQIAIQTLWILYSPTNPFHITYTKSSSPTTYTITQKPSWIPATTCSIIIINQTKNHFNHPRINQTQTNPGRLDQKTFPLLKSQTTNLIKENHHLKRSRSGS